MSLTIKKDSKWFYARLWVNGKREFFKLNVEIKGERPRVLKEDGNALFERSRARAQDAHDKLKKELEDERGAERYLKKLYKVKSGEQVDNSIPLYKVFDTWKSLREVDDLSSGHLENVQISCNKFSDFAGADTLMNKVTHEKAIQWINEIGKTRSARTRNHHLTNMRGVFNDLKRLAKLTINPFVDISSKRQETFHREPLTDKDIQALLNEADNVFRPVLITGLCTGMREGDCATLKNEHIDLGAGFANVKTRKTKAMVDIPIFPELLEELKLRDSGKYCWPEAAELYLSNRDSFVRQITKLFVKTGVKKYKERNGRKVSVKDFHSFRTTWITKALSSGVPIEVVKKVTGHTTVEVVLEHYFRPGRDDMKKALGCMMSR